MRGNFQSAHTFWLLWISRFSRQKHRHFVPFYSIIVIYIQYSSVPVAQWHVSRLLIQWPWVRTPQGIFHNFLASSIKRSGKFKPNNYYVPFVDFSSKTHCSDSNQTHTFDCKWFMNRRIFDRIFSVFVVQWVTHLTSKPESGVQSIKDFKLTFLRIFRMSTLRNGRSFSW